MKTNSIFSPADICHIAIFTALTVVLAQIIIPLPGGVPLSLSTLAVFLTGIVLGSKKGAAALLVYLLLGAVGVPVFAGFGAGLSRLVGPTGGFLLSYPLMAWISGRTAAGGKTWMLALGLILGTLTNYVLGVWMFCLSTGSSPAAALAACVLPFIVTDILKMALAASLGIALKRSLYKAGIALNAN